MSKRGLPSGVKMRHDFHYVDELARSTNRSVGRLIPINQIEPNPEQPRVEIGDLSELTGSIKQKGVLEPLLVKPIQETGTWMIIAGERRWRAATLAGLREVPCIEMDLDDKSIAEIALIENLQRKDLTVWEEADGLKYLQDRFGYTHEEIAKKIGKSRTTVTESLQVAGLPEDIREKCRNSNINAKATLLEIARQFDEKAMHAFLEDLSKRNLAQDSNKKIAPKLKSSPVDKISKKDAPSTSLNKFNFISKGNAFTLEIRFSSNAQFSKKDVLKALKEAFDETKKS